MLFIALSAQAQTSILPPIGGRGGGQFIARCPGNELLTGFELRAGDDVDAIRPLCVAAFGTRETNPVQLTSGSGLTTGKDPFGFDIVKLESGWYGGTGGGVTNVICPKDTPIVIGMYVRAEGVKTVTVNNIHLFCGIAATTQQPSEFPSAVFDGPVAKSTYDLFGGNPVVEGDGTQRCPSGLVGVGINGRSGVWLDAVGLICGEAKLPPKPVRVLGRVKVSPTGAPPVSICDSALRARARNNPAAPGLEAQCRATVNALAAKGEAIANQDPLATELRNQQPEGPARRGFDIGMAAAEGQTASGPGKQSIHDSLNPAEQVGFEMAVAFSLERNRNAEFAAKGAAIARADAVVAEARTVDRDVFYRLGFDIATGIFGNPALGAKGNTATGPGSLKIRNSLSDAGQRGFDAAVKLHLSRNYKP
jgi:hypothetical protein